MVQRGTLIAALVGVEIALVVMMVQSLNPGAHAPWHDAAMRTLHGPAGAAETPAAFTFVTGTNPEIVVDIGLADLTISRRDTAGVDVTVNADTSPHLPSASPPISARKDGETIKISAPRHGRWGYFEDDRMVNVSVPADARVTVIDAGNTTVRGLRAEASLNSSHGTITVDDFNAPALHVSSANGRLMLHRVVAAQINATSSNGRVEGTGLQIRDGRVSSSNGRVSLGFAPGADTTVTAATSNGTVKVSGFGTVTTSRVSAGDGDDGDDDDRDSATAKTIRIGAGSGKLDVHSSNGNIKLSQEG